jgi:hypothetical protein
VERFNIKLRLIAALWQAPATRSLRRATILGQRQLAPIRVNSCNSWANKIAPQSCVFPPQLPVYQSLAPALTTHYSWAHNCGEAAPPSLTLSLLPARPAPIRVKPCSSVERFNIKLRLIAALWQAPATRSLRRATILGQRQLAPIRVNSCNSWANKIAPQSCVFPPQLPVYQSLAPALTTHYSWAHNCGEAAPPSISHYFSRH